MLLYKCSYGPKLVGAPQGKKELYLFYVLTKHSGTVGLLRRKLCQSVKLTDGQPTCRQEFFNDVGSFVLLKQDVP